MVMLNKHCKCMGMMPHKRRVVERRGGVLVDAVAVGKQQEMGPTVNVELKQLVVGRHELTVLVYTCSWCGCELGQLAVATDGGQPNLPGVLS